MITTKLRNVKFKEKVEIISQLIANQIQYLWITTTKQCLLFIQKLHKFAIFVTRSAADSKWALIGREIGLNSNWITELVKCRSVMFLNILFWLNDWTIKFAHLPRYIPYFLFNTQQTKSMCSPKQQQIFQIFEKFRIKFHFLFILCIFSINSNAQSKRDKITD